MRFDQTKGLDHEAVRIGYVQSSCDTLELIALYLARIYDLSRIVDESERDNLLDFAVVIAERVYGVPKDGC